jgi:charged multivesicular body protein 4
MHEADLDKLAGMRLQLEVQVNTVESANINANTLDVMRRGANALRDIHNGLCVHPSHPSSSCYSNLISMLEFLFPVSVPVPSPFHPLPPAPRGLWVCSTIDKVDATMTSINEQRDIANEISETISSTANLGIEIDEVRLCLR